MKLRTPLNRRRRKPAGLHLLVALSLTAALAVLALVDALPEDEDFPEEAIAEDTEAAAEEEEMRSVPSRSRNERKKRILSLGGNGMIGTSVLSKLISADDEYDITLVSRGSWPFDSADVVKPHVRFVECDRDDRPECPDEEDDPTGWEECDDNVWRNSCPELIEAVRGADGDDKFWAVLDFSGYNGDWIWDAVDVMRDVARVYVYVSTDSVYEVSRLGGPGPSFYETSGGKKTTEDMAVRPDDPEWIDRFAEFDEYGHEKLEGEEVLQWQREEEETDDGDVGSVGIPFVSLRFSDVVGPRDGTGRYATYHMWAKYVGRVEGVPPFHIDEEVMETTSVTYVEDAAWSILKAMDAPESWDDAYNIASEEVFNVTEMLPLLGQIMGRDPSLLGVEKRRHESFSMFPSVTRGPVDVTKAKGRLGFKPTPLRKILEDTVAWYDNMFVEGEEIREEMVEGFLENVLDEDADNYEETKKRLWEAINEDVKEEKERREADLRGEEL